MTDVPQQCRTCGAELRPKAVFCHSCGQPVSSDAGEITSVSNTQNLASETSITGTKDAISQSANGLGLMPEESLKNTELQNTETDVDKPETVSDALKKLNKTRSFVRQTEYVWDEEEAPAWRVILVAILALGLVILLLWLSNFLR